MHLFNMVRTRRPPPGPRPRSTMALGLSVLLLLLVVASTACAFVVQPGGGRGSGRSHAPRVWDRAVATAAAPGPCFFGSSCGPPRPLVVLAAAEGETSSSPTAPGQAHAEAEDGLEEDVDPDMDEMLERTMHTVGIDWAGDDGHERLVDTPPQQQQQQPKAAGPAIPVDSPFAVYAAAIEPPSSHVVYYGGMHPRSFWRQGREAVQVVVPVDPATPKAAVRFRMESKTRLLLAVGDNVIFDRELAQPVYRDTSYWYFEQGGWGKAVVLELDKRLAYSNWPRLFPEDPDLSGPQQQPPKQEQLDEEAE